MACAFPPQETDAAAGDERIDSEDLRLDALEERDIFRSVLRDPFESVSRFGRNELHVIEDEEHFERVQDERTYLRYLHEGRAGQHILFESVLPRLERIRRRRLTALRGRRRRERLLAAGLDQDVCRKSHLRKLLLGDEFEESSFRFPKDKRLLTTHTTGSFFKIQPQAAAAFHDGRDSYCMKWTEAPPVGNAALDYLLTQFPRDGTGKAETAHKACGVGIMQFTFTTSDLPEYDNVEAQMLIVLRMSWATFVISETCESLIGASGEPEGMAINSCRFQLNEAKLFLARPLARNRRYTLAIRLRNPETTSKLQLQCEPITPTID